MYLDESRPEKVSRREVEQVSAWLEREVRSTRTRHRVDILHETFFLTGAAGVAFSLGQPLLAGGAAFRVLLDGVSFDIFELLVEETAKLLA